MDEYGKNMLMTDHDFMTYVPETIDALVECFPEAFQRLNIDGGTSVALARRNLDLSETQVSMLGGGAGAPVLHFLVNDDMADASVLGLPSAAANAYAIYETGKAIGKQKGVVFMYNNYMGDRINATYGVDLLRKEGIDAYQIGIADDMATQIGEERSKRNGQVALIYAVKAAKACAHKGYSAEQIYHVMEKINARCATLTCLVNEETGKVEYGNGFSGEPAVFEEDFTSLKDIVTSATGRLIEDIKPQKGEKAFGLVNKLATVHFTDAYLGFKYLKDELSKYCEVGRVEFGAYANLNMSKHYGFQFCVLLADEELQEMLKGTVKTLSYWI